MLSHLLPCEFVSADSMQIYRGMDIVTDKPSSQIRKKYPHHLLDIVSPSAEYNVSDFCKAAKEAIQAILKNKKTPVVIGGTGLYVNSLLYGIFEKEAKDENVRQRLEAALKEKGPLFFYEELKKVDPVAAARINPNDSFRIARALEVFEVTGTPISLLQKQRKGLAPASPAGGDEREVCLFGLRREREDLYRRVDQRVDFMINAGLLDEVRRLLEKPIGRTAYHCIGIREMEGFLKGQYNFEEARRLMKRNSRHFAKRQMTWFNKNKDIEWMDLKVDEDLEKVAKKILDKVVL